jgi:hypothetical protein
VQRIHARRTAQRAEARAGRQCEHCGVAIAATRSPRRFCSDICRVKAYREAARERPQDARSASDPPAAKGLWRTAGARIAFLGRSSGGGVVGGGV